MVKTFDVVGHKVVIHNDALGIPCFRKMWDSEKDKSIATDKISYIVLRHHPNSPYVKAYSMDVRTERLKAKLFSEDWIPTDDVVEAEKDYLEFMDTLAIKMLRGLRMNLETMTKSLEKMEGTEYSLKDMKELMGISAKAGDAIRSIKKLEEDIMKDDFASSKTRGGADVGHYELAKR